MALPISIEDRAIRAITIFGPTIIMCEYDVHFIPSPEEYGL